MAFWSKLFDNKKKANDNDDDGQEQYFKDEYRSVPKSESQNIEKTAAKPATKASAPKSDAKTTQVEAKKAKPASTTKSTPKASTKTAEATKTAKKADTAKATKSEKPATTKSAASVKSASASKSSSEKVAKAPTKAEKAPVKAEKAPVKAPKAKPVAAKEQELFDDSPEVRDAVAVKEGKETSNGKFDIRRAKDGRFFFSLYASNHTVIAYSQIYSSITAVNTGISSVIANATKAETEDTTLKKTVSLPCPKWEIYIDKAGEYRFRLYAVNGLCVCHSSHGYSTKSGCKGGIDSIKRFAAEATVNKSYLND